MLNANLKDIKTLLERANYACEILNKSDKIPIEQLVVGLDQDSKGRPLLLIIRNSGQDIANHDALLGITAPYKNYQVLQFIISLPFLVKDTQISDIARLVCFINKGIEFPGFEFSEVDRLVFFRHAFVVSENELDERITLSLVGMIQVLVDLFAETFESVANDECTVQDVIEDAKQKLLQREEQAEQFEGLL